MQRHWGHTGFGELDRASCLLSLGQSPFQGGGKTPGSPCLASCASEVAAQIQSLVARTGHKARDPHQLSSSLPEGELRRGERCREGLPRQGHQCEGMSSPVGRGGVPSQVAGKGHQPWDLSSSSLGPWCLGALVPRCQHQELLSIPVLRLTIGSLLSGPCQNETRGWAGLVGRGPLPLPMGAMDTR